jgi:hypothetical protein
VGPTYDAVYFISPNFYVVLRSVQLLSHPVRENSRQEFSSRISQMRKLRLRVTPQELLGWDPSVSLQIPEATFTLLVAGEPMLKQNMEKASWKRGELRRARGRQQNLWLACPSSP